LFLSSTKSSKTKTKFPIERKNEFRSFFPFLVLFHENAAIGKFLKKRTKGGWGAMLLGILFALAFCPTSGVFYFGMLMPLSAAETGGYLLPIIYAIATGLPIIFVAWILAYSVAGLGKFYNRMQIFEKWFRKIVAILFIAVGIYYVVVFYL